MSSIDARRDWPDIGPDPLGNPPVDYHLYNTREAALDRLSKINGLQQKEVPDQTALVWRADLSKAIGELHWRRCHLPLIRQQDEEIAALRASLCALSEAVGALQKEASDFHAHTVDRGWIDSDDESEGVKLLTQAIEKGRDVVGAAAPLVEKARIEIARDLERRARFSGPTVNESTTKSGVPSAPAGGGEPT